MAEDYSSQWIIKKEQLNCTPSVLDKIPLQQEEIQRSKGCSFIINVGTKLKLPQSTLATANIFLHRFYLRHSLKEYHYYDIAATCIFLACKVEDTNRKVRDIVVYCAKVAQKNLDLEIDEQTKEYWKWRDAILYTEEVLLDSLCFDLTLLHPYEQIRSLASQFAPESKDLTKIAWTYLNDSTRSITCLLHPSYVLAAASFAYALRKTKTTPIVKEDGTTWMQEMNVTQEQIDDVLNTVSNLFRAMNSLKTPSQGTPARSNPSTSFGSPSVSAPPSTVGDNMNTPEEDALCEENKLLPTA
ncbi:P-TEFB associated cyclin [Schizosaccharomyces japonicus yFS275]|uniref:p-TEFB associated cyclin n=1 Tax=Schizosaccharomyces japonicus (strain yFS275 / FY16936) TaxID=402676 RepID=B6K024_SCHJY|nr:P-TEFB associated cyclin [Schizosaccharomyces japonicus yFS275]EEB06174.1 P-TEFB associated cyclin [Schizosaccharomyces japonicus yFS275]